MAADRSSQLINVDGYATSAVFKSVPPEANSTLDPRAETKNFERPYLFFPIFTDGAVSSAAVDDLHPRRDQRQQNPRRF